MSQAHLRELPAVGAVLEDDRLRPWLTSGRRSWVTRLAQHAVADLRRRLQEGRGTPRAREELLNEVVQVTIKKADEACGPSWRRVINGTGVVVHTNLGRSCYPDLATRWMSEVAAGNSDLEFDLDSGTRGHRGRRVEAKIALLTGAEDALVVNNNAAAVWMAVRLLGRDGPVILSRGEVVAIGGSFRLDEILAETGCRLCEVGTTNRTSLADYREAMEPGATVLKVHRSNFVVSGFTEEASLRDLAVACGDTGCRLVYDAGSGALFPFGELGLPADERLLAEDVASGADLVTCSGDKLLGGGQAGIVLGKRQLISALRGHPMRRAFRVDKTTLAALDALLTIYLRGEERDLVPTIALLVRDPQELADRAAALGRDLDAHAPAGWTWAVVSGESSVGGGSFSAASVPTRLLNWQGPKDELEACHQLLRTGDPAVVARMNQEGLAVDLRTVADSEIPLLSAAWQQAWRRLGDGGKQR